MPRIFLPLPENPRTVLIPEEKTHYLTTVLRCRVGEELIIVDGKGYAYRTVIGKIGKREATAEVVEMISWQTESPLDLMLVQGLLKGEKMDLVVQKTTELGIEELLPVITERSQVRETRKTGRWRKIAEEAARQSGRTIVPVIHDPIPFLHAFTDPLSPLTERYPRRILCWEEGGTSWEDALGSHRPLSSVAIAVGPEGGFTKEEVQRAASAGFTVVSLGKRILRAETAAVSGVTILQFLFGDMGRPEPGLSR